MVIKGQFKVDGAKECFQRLNSIPAEIGEKIMKQAMHDASIVIRDEAKKTAPKREGRLEHFIGRTVYFDRRRWKVVSLVGMVNLGRGASKAKRLAKMGLNQEPYYAHMVELGTVHQKAQHFFKRAFETKREAFTHRLIEVLRTKLDRHFKSLARKGKKR